MEDKNRIPGRLGGKESACQYSRPRFDPWAGKMPWRRQWQPSPAGLTGEFHKQRSLVGYSPWGLKELDVTEPLNTERPKTPSIWVFPPTVFLPLVHQFLRKDLVAWAFPIPSQETFRENGPTLLCPSTLSVPTIHFLLPYPCLRFESTKVSEKNQTSIFERRSACPTLRSVLQAFFPLICSIVT